MRNFSFSFWLEIVYIVGPFVFLEGKIDGLKMFFFKFPRYNRLFERETAIKSFVDYYGEEWTVFE